MASPKQLEVRQKFKEAAKACKVEIAHLPKGQRAQAYRECIRRKLKTT